MSWTERASAPSYGTEPYDWSAPTIYECTWYSYWRVQEGGGYSPPCWYDRATQTGTYTNAKYWLNEYRDPWQVKGLNYSPVAGDIIVFTGNYGHCVVVEKVNANGTLVVTDYNLIAGYHQFGRKTDYTYGDIIQGGGGQPPTGQCIGALHYPSSTPPTPGQTENLAITITPSSASGTMSSSQDFIDFTFAIAISGIPAGETVSGGNTYPGLNRVANSGWSYSDYVVDGQTYRTATKTQTLRYLREYNYAYTITKYMYFNITKSTGTISTATPMYITVSKKANMKAILGWLTKRRKRGTLYVQQ